MKKEQIPYTTGKALKTTFAYLRPYMRQHIAAGLIFFLATICGIVLAELSRYFIDYALIPMDLTAAVYTQVYIVILSIIRGVMMIASFYVFHKLATKTVNDVMIKIFRYILRYPMPVHDKQSVGVLSSRVINDSGFLYDLICNTVSSLFVSVVSITVVLAWMFYVDWRLALVTLPFLPLYFFVLKMLNKKFRVFIWDTRDKYQSMNESVIESLSAIRHINVAAELCCPENSEKIARE